MGAKERFRFPPTLLLGLAIIAVSETLLVVDVVQRDWAVAPYSEISPPAGALQSVGRFVSVNITPICWLAYLLVIDGVLGVFRDARGAPVGLTGSPARMRPKRFIFCFLASAPIWLWFDWVNFSFIDAWRYHGLPGDFIHRNLGYFFAFGAICPAMFLTAELYQRLGLHRVVARPVRIGQAARIVLAVVGAAFAIFPFAILDPLGVLTMWLAWILLLDPLNHWLGAPNIIADWRAGRYGRTLSLLLAGLTCGFLWEFWNYWAVAKWTYHLPFLGDLNAVRFFEMPVVGLFGFPPFAIECWVMFQTAVFIVSKLRPHFLEPLPSNANVV